MVPGTQIFDDGSSVTFDANGNVTATTNSLGQPQYVPPADGSAVMQSFSALFSQGVQAVSSTVANKLKGSLSGASPQPGTPQQQASVFSSASLKKYLPAALVVVLAVAGYHYLKH